MNQEDYKKKKIKTYSVNVCSFRMKEQLKMTETGMLQYSLILLIT